MQQFQNCKYYCSCNINCRIHVYLYEQVKYICKHSLVLSWVSCIVMYKHKSFVTVRHSRPSYFSDLMLPGDIIVNDSDKFQKRFTCINICLYTLTVAIVSNYGFNQYIQKHPDSFATRIGTLGGVLALLKRIQIILGNLLLKLMLIRKNNFVSSHRRLGAHV